MFRKNYISIFLALVILWLSLSNPHTFEKVSFKRLPNFDKLVHFIMYFGLMSAIMFENRRFLNNVRQMLLLSVIPIAYGILTEILQTTLTTTRTGSWVDILFDILGVGVSVLLSTWLLPRLNGILK